MVILSLAYSLALVWIYYRAKKQGMRLQIALDVALMIMVGGFLGARLFHVFYEAWDHYRTEPLLILQFWRGGFVFFGGFFGALAAMAVYLHVKKESFLKWANFLTPVIAGTYALGRIACFMNGCCYGTFCDLPWAIEFDHPGSVLGPRHPTQLYATFWEGLVLIGLVWLERRKYKNIFFLWLILHGVGRLVMEYFRDDERGPLFLGFSVSSVVSVALIAVGLAMLWRYRKV